ncbi:hypothetical protein SAMD00019534_061090 [Acytostelium subglobosum LB1]|uniref:hypothetical protein n=1 Tax=Acytostelium subglobosum LB1 TaxID=1410327 RepID=UPI000644F8B9|nr:hypothetical protein SAMD00019534_061090 [Acytostelium subglobosum LB1]GAM22934.1 hypothetical protein SAMD00019534_061090 [Acytostelium subglobosum LB1]|eukprot:XP_012754161.1 hypothetical protein SAMD00019534_061090 [Acytostelium subglobosum LB1]
MSQSKDKNKMAEILEENESLKRSMQQNTQVYQDQTEALKHNIKSLYDTNKQLEDEILMVKKDMQQYFIKSEEQQATIRKLQVDIAELICSKEELETSIDNYKKLVNDGQMMMQQSDVQPPSVVVSSDGGEGEESNDQDQIQGQGQAQQTLATPSPMLGSMTPLSIQLLPLNQLLTLLDDDECWGQEDKDQIKTQIKTKLTELYDSKKQMMATSSTNSSQNGTPLLNSQKKDMIFHPLGEPLFNPEDEKEKSKLRETIKSLMEQIKENDGRTNKQQTEAKDLQTQVDSLNLSVKEWQDKHRAAEIHRVKIEEKLEADIKKLVNDISVLNGEKDDLVNQKAQVLQELQQTITKHQSAITDIEKANNEAKEQQEKQLNDKINELKEQKMHYETMVSDSTDQSHIYKLSRDEYAQSLKTMSEDLGIKDQLIEAKGSEISQLKETINNLEKDCKQTKAVLLEREAELNDTRANTESVSTMIKKAEEKLTRERASFDSLTTKFNKLNQDYSELETKSNEFEKQQKESDERILRMDESNASLVERTTQLGDQLDQLQTELKDKTRQIEELSTSLEEANKQLGELKDLQQLYDETKQKHEETQASCADLQLVVPQYEQLKVEHQEALDKVNKLETALADADTERKIAEKKKDKMIKDLKTELTKERSNASLLSQSSNSIPSTPNMSPLSQSSGSISMPTTPMTTPMKTHLRTMSKGEPLAPSTPPTGTTPRMAAPMMIPGLPPKGAQHGNSESMRNDIEIMGKKLGELGTEKYKLEEKIRLLEENVSLLNQDIEKKNSVVRFYISKTQLGKATTTDEKTKRLKGGAAGSFWRNNDPQLVGEMVEKMENILQENIMKNIQLTNDMEVLGNETGRLSTENRAIRQLLLDNGIPIPTIVENQPMTRSSSNNTATLSSSVGSSLGSSSNSIGSSSNSITNIWVSETIDWESWYGPGNCLARTFLDRPLVKINLGLK